MNAIRILKMLSCGLALLVVGCGQGMAPTPAIKAPSDGVTSSLTESVFHPLSLDQALEQAKAENKLVMADFYADWCGPCRWLDEKTWTEPSVQQWLREKTIAIKINVDRESSLAARHRLEGIPALLFFQSDGREVGRIVGFRDGEAFLREAETLIAGK